MEIRMNIAVITGASSGMGMEFARQIDGQLSKTDEIWLLARRREPMEETARSMKLKTRIIPIDMTNEREMAQFSEVLAISAPKITLLVNCAGVGFHGSFAGQESEEIARMMRLNIYALTMMTRICLPYMRKGSRIVQFASGAAFLPQAGFAVYAASKAYVYSYSRALGRELKQHGICVTTVCPGPVRTPFLENAYKDMSGIKGIKKLTMAYAADVVAQAIRDCKRNRKVSLYGAPMKLLYCATQGVQNMIGIFAQ